MPSPYLSPREQKFNRSPFNAAGSRFVGGRQRWTLARLSPVAWFEPRRFDVAFTDTSGSTPVSGAGSAVARANNLGTVSGFTVTQATSTKRPVLQQDSAGLWHWLYDGTDDCLFSGSNLNLTATDKITVLAAVRKLSDAAGGIIAETGAGLASTPASFFLAQGNSAGTANAQAYCAASRGTATAVLGQGTDATTYAAPHTAVLLAEHDIAGDLTTLEVNGVAAPNATADKGSGNFGNLQLFLGQRNSATIPMNGRLYGFAIIPRLLTAAEKVQARAYMAALSGVSL